jgi:hypothetical protein
MAVKKTRRVRRGVGNNSAESEAAAQLAPPEERKSGGSSNQAAANDGTLTLNTSELKLPQDLIEEKEDDKGFPRIDPVVLAILCFSLVFIAFIAYLIWSGWEPPQ